MSKILVAYYSRAGQNYVNGSIENLPKGNTKILAEFIQAATKADIFEIDTVQKYPVDYTECTNVAKQELHDQARPELKNYLSSIDEYDTIFLGFPCWWGLPPMAVFTFLEHYDFAGKKIIPFTTHEGSGFGGSMSVLKRTLPKSTVENGISIHGAEAKRSETQVKNFAKKFV